MGENGSSTLDAYFILAKSCEIAIEIKLIIERFFPVRYNVYDFVCLAIKKPTRKRFVI